MRKSNVENPFIKNLITLTGVIILIMLISFVINNINGGKNLKAEGVKDVSKNLGSVMHGVEDFSPGLVNYLQSSDYLGPIYKQGKKMVLYPPLDNTCPYGAVFMKAFETAMANPAYTSDYTFVTFESERTNNELYKKCHLMCVVNPQKNQLFYLGSVGPTVAEKLPMIFEGLKSW